MSVPQWVLAHGESLQVGLFFGLLVILAAIEPLGPRRPGPMHRASRWPTNLFFTALNLLALGALPVSIPTPRSGPSSAIGGYSISWHSQ